MIAPILETERLVLRPLTLVDWEAYARAWADPRMTAYIGGQPRGRTESWGKFLQGIGLWPLFGYGYWSFVSRGDGSFLGCGGLASFERGIAELAGFPEAGWAFVPDAWGLGLATEAVGAVLDWADHHLSHREIRCIIDPGNVASQRVATKLGFTFMGEVDFPPATTQLYRRVRTSQP